MGKEIFNRVSEILESKYNIKNSEIKKEVSNDGRVDITTQDFQLRESISKEIQIEELIKNLKYILESNDKRKKGIPKSNEVRLDSIEGTREEILFELEDISNESNDLKSNFENYKRNEGHSYFEDVDKIIDDIEYLNKNDATEENIEKICENLKNKLSKVENLQENTIQQTKSYMKEKNIDSREPQIILVAKDNLITIGTETIKLKKGEEISSIEKIIEALKNVNNEDIQKSDIDTIIKNIKKHQTFHDKLTVLFQGAIIGGGSLTGGALLSSIGYVLASTANLSTFLVLSAIVGTLAFRKNWDKLKTSFKDILKNYKNIKELEEECKNNPEEALKILNQIPPEILGDSLYEGALKTVGKEKRQDKASDYAHLRSSFPNPD